jgi:Helicase conserved C-terminal domain
VEPRRLLHHNEWVAATHGDRRRIADILAYWHAVEMFDPKDIPRPRRREGLTRKRGTRPEQAISIVKGEPLPPLPWQPGHPRYGDPPPEEGWYGSSWRHTVYGGVFSLGKVRAALARVLGYSETEDYGGTRKDADGALFAFTVDEDGILIENTAAFSSCAWATGRLHRPGPGAPDWLDGFGDVTGECEQALYRLLCRPVSYLPSSDGPAPGESRDWLTTVTEILMDGAGLLALCSDNLVYECPLAEGVERGNLSPFRYFGIADDVDYTPIPWRGGRFGPAALTEAVETQERAQHAPGVWRGKGGGRTIAFCVTVSHADFMAGFFRRNGVAAVAVHSGPASAPRAGSVEQLRAGELQVICTVDVFSEGLDVPEAGTVLMLRPTGSPVVFL